MGLFEKLFGKRPEPKGRYEGVFKMLDGYTPHFSTRNGGVYESELIRAAINARATQISKLNVQTFGSARPALQNKLKHGPNEFPALMLIKCVSLDQVFLCPLPAFPHL